MPKSHKQIHGQLVVLLIFVTAGVKLLADYKPPRSSHSVQDVNDCEVAICVIRDLHSSPPCLIFKHSPFKNLLSSLQTEENTLFAWCEAAVCEAWKANGLEKYIKIVQNKLPSLVYFEIQQIIKREIPAAPGLRAAAAGNKGVIWYFIHRIRELVLKQHVTA